MSSKVGSKIKKFSLLFRASDHNFSAKKFYEICDDKASTITIIKSNYGTIFGGYTSTDCSWISQIVNMEYIPDDKSFLFLIRSNDANDEVQQKSLKCYLFRMIEAVFITSKIMDYALETDMILESMINAISINVVHFNIIL